MDQINVRCSALPRVMRCAASELADVVRGSPDHSRSGAGLGRAVHALLADAITGREVDPSAQAIAHGADVDETRILFRVGMRLWTERISALFPVAHTETPGRADLGDGVTLTGSCDLSAWVGTEVRVLDWKTGRVDTDHRDQVLGYCSLALRDCPDATRAVAVVCWLRTEEVEIIEATRAEVEAWEREVVAHLRSWSGDYHPGPACTYCPRQIDCPARAALVRRSVEALTSEEVREARHGDLAEFEPHQIIALRERVAVVKKACDAMDYAIRQHVQRFGAVEADGHRLEMQPVKRREIDTSAAWEVLLDALPDGALAECVDVRLSAVEKAVAQAAGRGNGAQARRELARRLEEAGAVRTRHTERLTMRRLKGGMR